MKNLNEVLTELEKRSEADDPIEFRGFKFYITSNDFYGTFYGVDLTMYDFVSAFTIKELRKELAAKYEAVKKWDMLLRTRQSCSLD